MSTTNEVDILDVVRRLRRIVNDLDNCNFLSDQVKKLDDPMLTRLAEKVVDKVAGAAVSVTGLLKHVENNRAYRDLVKRYRSPNYEEAE